MKRQRFLQDTLHQLRPVVFYAATISFFINLLILPMSLYSLQVFDRVMSTGSMATLLWLTVLMLVIFAVAGLLQTLRSNVMTRAGDWLHAHITQTAIPISLTHIAASQGSKNIQSLRDAAALRQFLGGPSLTALMDAPWAVLSILVLFLIHPALGALITVGALLLVALAWVNERITDADIKQAGALQLKAMQDLEIAARNTDVVEAMGMAPRIMARWKGNQQSIAEPMDQANSRGATIQGITKFVRLSLQVLVTALSAWLALHNAVTVGAIIASSILAGRALAPFEAAIASWKSALEAKNAYGRLKETLVTNLRTEDISLPAPEGRIAVENVYYAAPNQQKAILRNVSFKLEPGESLGIIGPSGSGKTTLARLLTGTWKPAAGTVRLDGADVYSWPREEFGNYVGYMPQDVELFGGSVKENIGRLNTQATDEAVVEAAQLANAHELILKLPNGYSSDIGANGAFLSAGQRQRVGLARAFFGMPRLLVLDEPDSNLDDAGQAALVQALQYAHNYTMTAIVISHRRAILQHVDKILYLKDGAVEAFGPAKEVVAQLANITKNTEKAV